MPLIPEDPVKRCGVWFLSTSWIWKAAHKLKLTKLKDDPFLEVCEVDDDLTDAKNPFAHKLTNEEELERVDAMFDEVNKDAKRPRLAAFYKGVLHALRGIFDR